MVWPCSEVPLLAAYGLPHVPLAYAVIVLGGGLTGPAGWLKGTVVFATPGLALVAVGARGASRGAMSLAVALMITVGLLLGVSVVP